MSKPDIQTTVVPGQIWRPAAGTGAFDKLVTNVTVRGAVYAVKHPRTAITLPSYFSKTKWREWVRRHGAQCVKST